MAQLQVSGAEPLAQLPGGREHLLGYTVRIGQNAAVRGVRDRNQHAPDKEAFDQEQRQYADETVVPPGRQMHRPVAVRPGHCFRPRRPVEDGRKRLGLHVAFPRLHIRLDA